jgi:ABC-type Fe3+-hydroxamate transport system substrate-binding protein
MEDNIFLLIVPKEKREEAGRLDFPEIIATYSVGWEEDSSYRKYTTSWMQCDNVIKQHLPLYQKAEAHLRDCEDKYKAITETLKEKTEQKRALNLQFYKKYSRFIQEGSWIKEDYVDDNLYYLDSLSTLHTSA